MTSIEADFAEAIRLRDLGDTFGALAILTRLADLEDAKPGIHAVIGHLYLTIRDLPKAIESFRRATEMLPASELASVGLFHALVQSQRDDEAFAEMRRFLAIADSPEYQRLLKEINEAPDAV